ncbi:MAG: NAD(P)/FAD-dependent oxidoreductase [Bacteroidota bacterium]
MSYEVIIIGGSYAGLSAALTLGRSLRRVLVIDEGLPCNRQTPHSHNFLTQDHVAPAEIARKAREQVQAYPTVNFLADRVTEAKGNDGQFVLRTRTGQSSSAHKLIFGTGVKDILPEIEGFAACWGITAIHCPYCHGYEVKGVPTGILASGEMAIEYATLIKHWTNEVTVFSQGSLDTDKDRLEAIGVRLETGPIQQILHDSGHMHEVILENGRKISLQAMYHRPAYTQHCSLPEEMGCELTEQGHLKVDMFKQTTIPGIYAVGDATTPMRAVSSAVASGTMAGAGVNRELIFG